MLETKNNNKYNKNNNNKNYACCSLSYLLKKINNYESHLVDLIISFYFNILVSDVKHIYKYLDLSYRFKKGVNFVKVIKEIKKLLRIQTILPHYLSERTLLNGILKSTLKGRIIDRIETKYEYICRYDTAKQDFIKNYDFFMIDVYTTKKGNFRIYINPTYEFCYIQDYYIIKSNRYYCTKLSELYWIFNNRNSCALKQYSRLNYKHGILKNIQDNTIKFFGLSTYYFWNSIKKERMLNQNNIILQQSIC